MKKSKWMRISVLMLSVSVLYFCSANPLEPDMEDSSSLQKGIPTDQINWATWNSEVTSALAESEAGALGKRKSNKGFDSKNIHNHSGGSVGGDKTFGNTVDIPEGAFEEHTLKISVRVLQFDGSGQTAAGVEFLPSRNYDADVSITLSWAFLDVDEEAYETLNLQPYFSEDGGNSWFPVEDYAIDTEARTINFDIDHFTQYGWALDEDD